MTIRIFISLATVILTLFACSNGSSGFNGQNELSSSSFSNDSSSSEVYDSNSGTSSSSSSSSSNSNSSSSNLIDEPSSSSNGASSSSSNNATSGSLLINFTSDYKIGVLRWMKPSAISLDAGTIALPQDSKVSAGGGNIFVLSRLPGSLTCISPKTIGDANTIKQRALATNNPYDAAVIGSKGYIALFDADYVQIFNTNTCELSGRIDLPISGANAASIKSSGDTLFVILQRLESLDATKPGLLVRIKASTETVIDTIQLKLYNPYASILSKGKLYVSAQSRYNKDWSYDYTKSGVEVVNLATGTTDVLITGTNLGGGAYSIAIDEANQILYVSVSASTGNQPVKPVTLDGNAGAALPNITDSSGDIVFDEEAKKLFVGDRAGLKVYNPATKLTTAINQGGNALPPYSLSIARW
jgi:hypothetical protein